MQWDSSPKEFLILVLLMMSFKARLLVKLSCIKLVKIRRHSLITALFILEIWWSRYLAVRSTLMLWVLRRFKQLLHMTQVLLLWMLPNSSTKVHLTVMWKGHLQISTSNAISKKSVISKSPLTNWKPCYHPQTWIRSLKMIMEKVLLSRTWLNSVIWSKSCMRFDRSSLAWIVRPTCLRLS